MKLLLDFLPLILFFGTFKYAKADEAWAAQFASEHFGFMVSGGKVGTEEAPVLLATLVVIVATLLQALIIKLRGKKIDLLLWISLTLVVVLGGLTVWFHNKTFIMWKPTGLYWAGALTFVFSQLLFGKNLIKAMLGKELELPEAVWRRLNLAWVVFFTALGFANLYVAYNFDDGTWVNFKVYGVTGLILLFTLGQGLYIARFLGDDDAPADKSATEANNEAAKP